MSGLIDSLKNNLTFENVLSQAMRAPGVKIDRAGFLQKELQKYEPQSTINKAIKENPAIAGIPKELINTISQHVIDYETTKVTGISVAASIPGGAAAIGAASADIVSYFAFVLRTVQELAYLYGFKQFDFSVEDSLDSETMQIVLVFIGTMFGVSGAEYALKGVAEVAAKNISKKLAQKALTKGVMYPIIKKVATAVGFRMTKQIFADTVASAVPLAGGALSGGLTYIMFKPGCQRLRDNLMSYNICDPDFYRDVVDAEE